MKSSSPLAFTLVEIMIVVAIIGLLAAIAVPAFRKSIADVQKQACAMNRRTIDGAKLRWALDNHQPPTAVPLTMIYSARTRLSNTSPAARQEAPTRLARSTRSVPAVCRRTLNEGSYDEISQRGKSMS